MIYITDAYKGEPHIYAEHVGFYNLGTIGYDNGYFPNDYAGNFSTEVLNNNMVRIKAGIGLIGGRRFTIKGSEDVVLESGATGENRIDVIYFVHTQDDDGMESISIEVIKGVPTAGTPAYNNISSTGPIPNIIGTYRTAAFLARFEGVNIISVEMYEGFQNLRSIRNVYEYAFARAKQLGEVDAALQRKCDDLLVRCNDLKSSIDGTSASFEPSLYSYANNGADETKYYAGGYTVRQAKKMIIAGRCFLDIWITINSLGNIGTGERILRIQGTKSSDIPKSGGGLYSAAISYVSGMADGTKRPAAAVAPGAQYISLFLNSDFLKAKDITENFQIRLSVSYDAVAA